MKIQKINSTKFNNKPSHQKISFGENKVENVSKNNKHPKKNKIFEYTKNIFAILGILLTIQFKDQLYYFFKRLFKK